MPHQIGPMRPQAEAILDRLIAFAVDATRLGRTLRHENVGQHIELQLARAECSHLIAIFVASIRTAKSSNPKSPTG